MTIRDFTTSQELFSLLDIIEGAGIRVLLHGGWALDALTGVEMPHHDIDLIAAEKDRNRLREVLKEYVVEERSHKLGLDYNGAGVDMVLYGTDWLGRDITVTPKYLVRWDPEAMKGLTGTLHGRTLHTIGLKALFVELAHPLRKTEATIAKNNKALERIRHLMTPEILEDGPNWFPSENRRWNRFKFRLGF